MLCCRIEVRALKIAVAQMARNLPEKQDIGCSNPGSFNTDLVSLADQTAEYFSRSIACPAST